MLRSVVLPVVGLGLAACAHANIAIPGSLTETVQLEVGDTYEGAVTVTNATNEVQRVDVRILDRQPAPQRRFVEPGSVEASAAPFLVPEATEFVLAPQERRQFRYQIVVPEDFQGDAGSYWTTLMFEPFGQVGDVGDTQGAAIVSKMRIAYGVIVHLGDPPAGGIEIRDVRRIVGEDADDPAAVEEDADVAPLVLGATFSVAGSKVVERFLPACLAACFCTSGSTGAG
ncbi:MAG: hypothetical protein RI554_10795, partial [Trueperaceae bacterium]|nr:hypothetical protein [Trueperaceae bacterium]